MENLRQTKTPYPRTILASSSPRRKELLGTLGLKFEICPANVNEDFKPGEGAAQGVLRLALEKARAIQTSQPEALIIAADTLVVLDYNSGRQEKVLGKPPGVMEAESMLAQLSGREHTVLTAFALLYQPAQFQVCELVESRVEFRELSPKEIKSYVQTGEPMDKAGAYALQGVGAQFVKAVFGSVSNVIGLPLAELSDSLKKLHIWEAFPGERDT